MAAAPPPALTADAVRALLQDENLRQNSETILKIQNKLVSYLGYQDFVPTTVPGAVEDLVVPWGAGPAGPATTGAPGGEVTFNAMPGKVIDFDGLTAPERNPSTPFKVDLSDPKVIVLFGLMSTRDNWSTLYESRRQELVDRANFPAITTQADADAMRDRILKDRSLRVLNPDVMPPMLLLKDLAEIKKGEGDTPQNRSPRITSPWVFETLQAQLRRELASGKNTLGSIITLPSPSVYIEKDDRFISRYQLQSEDLGITPGIWGYIGDVVKSTLGFIRRRVEASELPYMQRASKPDERMTNQKLRDMIISGRFPYDPTDPGRAVPYIYKPREPVQLDLLKSQRSKENGGTGRLVCEPLFTEEEVAVHFKRHERRTPSPPLRRPLGSTGDIGKFLAPNNEARPFIDRGVPAPGERDPAATGRAAGGAPIAPAPAAVAAPEGSRRYLMNTCGNTCAPGRMYVCQISDY